MNTHLTLNPSYTEKDIYASDNPIEQKIKFWEIWDNQITTFGYAYIFSRSFLKFYLSLN